MKYVQKTFTLPTVNTPVSERQYDYATLTEAEFVAKYGDESVGYTASQVSTEEVATTPVASITSSFHPTPPLKE